MPLQNRFVLGPERLGRAPLEGALELVTDKKCALYDGGYATNVRRGHSALL